MFWKVIQDWQDLTAGVLGFTAAIIAVLIAWEISRSQERKFTRNVIKGITVEALFICEQLIDLVESLTQMIMSSAPNQGLINHTASNFYAPNEPRIFPNNTGQIGNTNAAYELVRFHAGVQTLRDYMKRLEGIHVSISPIVDPPYPLTLGQITSLAVSVLSACYLGKAALRRLPDDYVLANKIEIFEIKLQKSFQEWCSRFTQDQCRILDQFVC